MESQTSFYLFPGQINEVIYGEPQTPETISVQTRLENALHNAFKAVKAVIGDPPKDERRLDAKLQAIGLDPKAWVGYKTAQPLHSVIRTMSEARDKKAAHGSTPDRAITVAEMLEFQACARLLVWAAVEKEHGTAIQSLPAWFEDAMADEYRRAHPEIGL